MAVVRSKNKLARREATDLSLKTFGTKAHAGLLKRLNIVPGFKQTRKRMAKMSDYGRQLREKQKLKRIYSLQEKVMHKYFNESVKSKGNTAEFLIKFLEGRLDNVLYRLKLAPTRLAARQYVSHGHVLVNGKKVDVPSFQLEVGDVVEFKTEKIRNIPSIKEMLDQKNIDLAKWLKRDGAKGEVVGKTTLEDYSEPVNLALVIEFYSKL